MANKRTRGREPVRDVSRQGRWFWVAGLVAAVFAVGLLFAFRPWESVFEGAWVRQAGDANAPDSIEVQVANGRLKAVFADRNPLSIGNVGFTLILDGREHPWSGESSGKEARQLSSYLAWMDRSTLHLKRRFHHQNGSDPIIETQWQMHGRGELAIVTGNTTTVYRRSSWLGALFS